MPTSFAAESSKNLLAGLVDMDRHIRDLNKNQLFVLNIPLSQVDRLPATHPVAFSVGGKDPIRDATNPYRHRITEPTPDPPMHNPFFWAVEGTCPENQ